MAHCGRHSNRGGAPLIEVGQVRIVVTNEWYCWGSWENGSSGETETMMAVTAVGQKLLIKALHERMEDIPQRVQFLDIYGRTWYASPYILDMVTEVL